MSGSARLQIDHSMDGDTARVVVAGDLDGASSPELEMQVDALLAQGARNLVFDCTDVSFIDSSALRVIVGAELKAGEHSGTVTIARPSDNMRAIMGIAGITDMIEG